MLYQKLNGDLPGGVMGVRLVVPTSIKPGYYKEFKNAAIGLWAHTLQCDQRWIFLFRLGKYRFGYRTKGDATKDTLTYYDAGWHFGKIKHGSGRG